jgi:hypothetical protein
MVAVVEKDGHLVGKNRSHRQPDVLAFDRVVEKLLASALGKLIWKKATCKLMCRVEG